MQRHDKEQNCTSEPMAGKREMHSKARCCGFGWEAESRVCGHSVGRGSGGSFRAALHVWSTAVPLPACSQSVLLCLLELTARCRTSLCKQCVERDALLRAFSGIGVGHLF